MSLTFFDMSVDVWTLGAAGRSTDSTRQVNTETINNKSLGGPKGGGDHSSAILWCPFRGKHDSSALTSPGGFQRVSMFFNGDIDFLLSHRDNIKLGSSGGLRCGGKSVP